MLIRIKYVYLSSATVNIAAIIMSSSVRKENIYIRDPVLKPLNTSLKRFFKKSPVMINLDLNIVTATA